MFAYDFMVHALVAASIVAIVSGAVGWFLLLRGQAFAAHALGHIGFSGATGAVLVGASPLAGLLVFTFAGGVAMGALGERLEERDVAIGMVLALALGFGVLFLHFYTAFATQATALLFGNVLAVDVGTVWALLGFGAVALGALATIARPLLFASLEPEIAEARGLSLRLIGMAFLAIVAIATAESAEIVGVLLVFTLMVGPAAAAYRLTSGVLAGIALSVALALVEAWGGLTLAFYTNAPTSFWITALSGAVYGLTLLPLPTLRPSARIEIGGAPDPNRAR